MDSELIALGPQGRLVVPARFRKELNLQPGDRLVMRLAKGALVLEPQSVVQERLRARFSKVNHCGVSLAGELIRERRREAKRESR
jgi:AbrB family looped-hinge helix DNA binding protein